VRAAIRFSLNLSVLVSALCVAACGEDDTGCANGDALCNPDTGASDAGQDAAVDAATDAVDDGSGEGSEEPIGCTEGIDENGDGVCDNLVADWTREASIPLGTTRADIYQLGEARNAVAERGIAHTVNWPVSVSGSLLPWRAIYAMLDPDATDDTVVAAQAFARNNLGFGNIEEMYDWLGLARFDGAEEAWPGVRWPSTLAEGTAMGAGVVDTEWGEALTYSCALCHTGELFGRTVLGMTNRRSRANEYFNSAAAFYPSVTPTMFRNLTDATPLELELFERTAESLGRIGSRVPQARGLDTSLAQTALSLARRTEDTWATPDRALERNPRENALETFVADSKSAVWWTMRYKTRWLSDGSIVSGNPVFTNFLWNEIGRGTDLHELEAWERENRAIIDELTVTVFATESPRWEDWFGTETIDIEAAQRGQEHFEAICATCHGSYTKGWDTAEASALDTEGLIANVRLDYYEQTPVLDVGTDTQRAEGMAAFAQRLNELAISQWMGTVVEVQPGYVPPPLDGIWARYPYLHNGSVPTLCEMLVPAAERTALFYAGPSVDPETDFDMDCIGYPTGEAVPVSWTEDPYNAYDVSRPGMGNFGHEDHLLGSEGQPLLDAAARADLIEFLKTL
jgi:mono/diheme cytochrome c family protein